MSNFLSEFVYGSTDGIITTFSIVAGSIGGELSRNVVLILGLSNVLSDGYSMGVSRYLSAKTEIQQGLLKGKEPITSAIATFISFVIIGLTPIIPFLLKDEKTAQKISLYTALTMFFIIGVVKGYYVEKEKILVTGDTLFRGSIGNLSLPTSEGKRIWASLEKIRALPQDTRFFPGHADSSTLGEEAWLAKAEEIFGEI